MQFSAGRDAGTCFIFTEGHWNEAEFRFLPKHFPTKLEWGWQGAAPFLLTSLELGPELSEQIPRGCSHPGSWWVPLSPFPQSCHQSQPPRAGNHSPLVLPWVPSLAGIYCSTVAFFLLFFFFLFFLLWVGFEIIIVLGGSRKGFADSLLVFMT